ncbi:GGDEF domain-containing protein [Caldanaerobius polysaccharolyticus]|uniref:GGDEF domain-containing protein n=1 Tax=Caldanaerobius polysaccharolyticus TaxID=44256 RepID=UPI00047E2BE6|nr:GGDEF domain-containing protein [Caldanaerobius polysaccharolyticus]
MAEMEMVEILKHIIASKNVISVFQPIVSLTTGNVIGYEALSRGPKNTPLEKPEKMFEVAKQNNMLWELEMLCRSKALEKSCSNSTARIIFLNVDPHVINDENFVSGFAREFLAKYKIDPSSIIFEITEKTAIEDYKSFKNILKYYVEQGYKIAIDDTGAGYSGLKTIVETNPQYIKVDMSLVRDIDKDQLKQNLMKTFYQFSINTNCRIIAEGIETHSELDVLIDIGIQYGQGYLLQKPAEDFVDIRPEAKEYIIERNKVKRQFRLFKPHYMPIENISRKDLPVKKDLLAYELEKIFENSRALQGVCVVNEQFEPIGLIMKKDFYSYMARPYGRDVFGHRPISRLMNQQPLIVDSNTPIDEVSRMAMSRDDEHLYDYIIISKGGKYFGITTVKDLLEKTTEIEINVAKYSNPLTGLPGNVIIDNNLKELLNEAGPFSLIYIDINNFKAYNDTYGFENGDKVILYTADILKSTLNKYHKNGFLGHIGGDDFVIIAYDHDVENMCQEIIELFDKNIRGFYNEQDAKNGFIVAKSRYGKVERIPIMGIAVAAITNKHKNYANVYELSESASRVKKLCKQYVKSHYIID